MGNKITMQDIANNLGLSKSLVSRALSDSYSVSENTKALIRNEASRIGYTAKPYKKRAANSNGILLLAPSSSLVDHSFYYQIFNDIENECAARGMRLMVCATENFYLPSKNDIAGVIVFANAPPDTLKALLAVGIPVVLVDFNYQMLLDDFIMAFDHVSSECNNSIYLLVKHLPHLRA